MIGRRQSKVVGALENGYLIVRTSALWVMGYNVYRPDPGSSSTTAGRKVNPGVSWFSSEAAARVFARGQLPA